MTLRLYLLGSPRAERDGQPIATDTRKAVALLAYLAVNGEFQSRDTLAALLWPEMSDKRARAALRRTLSVLRAAVGDAPLYVTRDGMSIIEDECWCDVVAFQAAVGEVNHHAHSVSPCPDCLPKLATAVSLYRDHFLSGFSLRDTVAFDNWQLAMTEHLRRTYATALAWLVQAYTQAGELDKAIELGRSWLAADPLREEAHRWLMQLYTWNGARDAALRQYRDAVHILDEELGVEPLPETTALYEAIQEGRLEAPAATSPPSRPAMPPAKPGGSPVEGSPLIGRESAWVDLLAVYNDIAQAGRLAAVTGETGIGKTHLVKEFLKRARAAGAVTITATCYEGEANLAYAPITAALRALLDHPSAHDRLSTIPAHWLAEAARLVPELEMAQLAQPESNMPAAQTRFFNGISEVLCRLLSGNVPGILFLDDIHWADDASLDLLAYLARRLNELPFMLLLSWADEKAGPSGDATRPRRLMSEAQRVGTGRLIALPRWRPSDVLALVTMQNSLLPRAAEITDRLYRETEGLPYFVVEYLAMLGQAPDKWAMPQSVHALLAGRLA
ncbi:MAG: AAA family ATPase, partial [Candidatus Promineofilum sp.]|nr:AAA family ATPase [Promineifilum sp.]